jgi:hypothetical protein
MCALFNNSKRETHHPKLSYGTAKGARNTIRRIKKMPLQYKKRAAQTMYYRAKFHKFQTKGMKDAERIYFKYLQTLKRQV